MVKFRTMRENKREEREKEKAEGGGKQTCIKDFFRVTRKRVQVSSENSDANINQNVCVFRNKMVKITWIKLAFLTFPLACGQCKLPNQQQKETKVKISMCQLSTPQGWECSSLSSSLSGHLKKLWTISTCGLSVIPILNMHHKRNVILFI